ncbi:uncharacterized protein [Alexandromys fortis]|uniref:uncharacterized protein isoform X1 n=1 Tax=Alexandromys fortis TaxID=100897 RepID=UPI0021538591|nr:uncharacterized protein LOC126516081 isoform X1 [Microtus fortis]
MSPVGDCYYITQLRGSARKSLMWSHKLGSLLRKTVFPCMGTDINNTLFQIRLSVPQFYPESYTHVPGSAGPHKGPQSYDLS